MPWPRPTKRSRSKFVSYIRPALLPRAERAGGGRSLDQESRVEGQHRLLPPWERTPPSSCSSWHVMR